MSAHCVPVCVPQPPSLIAVDAAAQGIAQLRVAPPVTLLTPQSASVPPAVSGATAASASAPPPLPAEPSSSAPPLLTSAAIAGAGATAATPEPSPTAASTATADEEGDNAAEIMDDFDDTAELTKKKKGGATATPEGDPREHLNLITIGHVDAGEGGME